ncbi:P-loop containing nucleoside triphosphate hydrolase protein [Aspergillus avenaceus]|uniref:ATP-dependent RNA helicase n=1 Tax=Aspergillus avenaceus TaxID=36643 RepID=A0A5N6U040_ASPAV|nr:P-loop containing nucleoside triphosphate hydrolase protein [Aspergillus avenaceus]
MGGDKSAHSVSSKKHYSTPMSANKPHKRKRDADGSNIATSTPTPTKKPKKSQSPLYTSTPPKSDKTDRKKKRRSDTGSDNREDTSRKEGSISPAKSKSVISSENAGKDKIKKKSKKSKRESPDGSDISSKDFADPVEMDVEEQGTSTANAELKATESEEEDSSQLKRNKFSGLLSKFEKAVKAKGSAKGDSQEGIAEESTGFATAEPVIAKGLEPLPQPEVVPEQEETPTYSSLPSWLANPLRTSAEERTPFSSLGIEDNVLRILEDNGYKEAFAVQSAVIPLLLQGPKNHPGDLCISAATGSGKTLSYVLPLVTALDQVPAPRLRGLIVVPTRELVKQAREACELCAAGSGLRVASAVGNVAIKDEQRSLMRIDDVYGPENFKSRQNVNLTDKDWTNFSLQDYISDAGNQSESLPGYIRKTEPNVDILICTPGRLVDHIRYTKGFTLKHLEWLVIDEADRLLNESFQEWVDVVMNSLDARKEAESFGFSGKFLASLGLPIQTRDPRKVILSATMTRDISKLNSLRLSHPKLVIVGSTEEATSNDGTLFERSDDQFTLPPRLTEHSVPVGDGSQKPLYLLRLLQSHIKVNANKNSNGVTTSTSDSEDTSSDESSSDESEESDSDTSGTDTSSSDESNSEDSDSDSDSTTSSESSDSDDSSESEDEQPVDDKEQHARPRATALVFTKSSESASRLSRLLSLLDPSLASQIGTIIKSNKSSASRKTLTAYRQGKISIIIATDRASRGLDLQSLTNVINYDVPSSITTYVHRVGRTARAGREGSSWTLIAHREGRWFMKEIAQRSDSKITRSTKVQRVSMKLDNMKDVKTKYKQALEALEKEVRTGGNVKS